MDADVKLTCNVTDGSYCFGVHNLSGISGTTMQQFSSRTGASLISLASTLNVANVITTLDNPQGTITVEKFTIDNANNGAVSGAFINLVNVNDASVIRDLTGFYFPNIGLNISGTSGSSSGPLNIDNCYFYGGKTASRPLVIQSDGTAAVDNINVMGGYYNAPGSSLAAIEINGGGSTTGALGPVLISIAARLDPGAL